jgi:hypothetical protein
MATQHQLLAFIQEFLQGMEGAFKETSTSMLEFELRETENIFGVLVMGSVIGMPSPPTSLSLRLLPYMLRETLIMTKRTKDLDDVFGEVAGMFEI